MSAQHKSFHPYILQAHEGEAVWWTTARVTLKATSTLTGGALSLVEVLAPPDYAPPWHVHHHDDEMFYILDGSFLFKCGDELFEAGPGAFVFLPRDIAHSFKNVGETQARFLVLNAPAGFDQFIVDAGTPALEEGLPPQPFDFGRMAAVAAKYGVEILGPPPF